MKISRQLKLDFQKVALITTAYVGINLFFFFFNYALLNSPYSKGPTPQFIAINYFYTNVFIGVIAGLLGGVLLVTINSQVFRKRSFKFAMLSTLVSYVSIFVLVTLVATFVNTAVENGWQNTTYSQFKTTFGYVMDATLFTYFILWGGITLFTLFLLQVNDKFGPGILFKFLAGNYHHPQKEERIFMFLDMRSSTTIAEKIGNEQYFNLLKDLFSDITDTILNKEGEIYQYVGDEIVISWPIHRGARHANCLHCFIEIKENLKALGQHYQQKYGLVPELKAGIHYGLVMAGEIGVIKKDIIYSGDVLNTTARIQEQCNPYNVDILISKETFELLLGTEAFELLPLGSIELRGKENKIDLNTVKVLT